MAPAPGRPYGPRAPAGTPCAFTPARWLPRLALLLAAALLVAALHVLRPAPALLLDEEDVRDPNDRADELARAAAATQRRGGRTHADKTSVSRARTARTARTPSGMRAGAQDASAGTADAGTAGDTEQTDVMELEIDDALDNDEEDRAEPGDDEAERARDARVRQRAAAASRPAAARKPKPSSTPARGGEDDDDDNDKTPTSSYHNCPTVNEEDSKRPGMDGLHTGLPHGYNRTDIFVHQRNHERVCKGEYAIHWRHVAYLPPDGSTVERTYRFRSCAVVGNGGGMRLMNLGRTIDSHDVVLRLNQAPTSAYRRFVGMKTTFRLLNRLWTAHYGSGRFIEMGLPMERGLTIVVTRSTGRGFDKMHRTIFKYRPDVAILYLSSRVVSAARRLLVSYRVRLCKEGYGPYPGGSTPSSGYVAIFAFMHMCQSVTVYGFGKDKAHGIQVPYHYYTGTGSRYAGDPVHSFAAEEHLMREMSRVGLIKFCSYMDGNTTAALKNNEECGFNPFLLKTKPAVSGQAAVDTAWRQSGGDGSGSRVDGVFERLYGENGRDAQHAATAYAKSRTPGAPRPARKSVLDEADGIEG